MHFLAKFLCGFILLSLLVAEDGFGQNPTEMAETYVARLANLRSGIFSFSTSEGLIFKTKPFQDTSLVAFSDLGTPDDFQFVIHNGKKVIFYHKDSLYRIDTVTRRFSLQVISPSEVVKECRDIFFSPILNRGANILQNLSLPSASVNFVAARGESKQAAIEIHCSSLGHGDTSIKNIEINYRIKDSLICGYEDHYDLLGGRVSHEGHLLQYHFSDSTLPTVRDACFQIRKAIQSGEYTLLTPHSVSEREVQEVLLSVGSTAPDITGISERGMPGRISSMDADLFVLDFWYAGCGPCLEMLPSIQQVSDSFKEKRIAVVGINPYDDLTTLQRVLQAKHLNYPQLVCSSTYVADFGIVAFPTVYILDRNLKVLSVLVGNSPGKKDELTAVLLAQLKALQK